MYAKRYLVLLACIFIISTVLPACSPSSMTLPTATPTKPQAIATILLSTATPTTKPLATPTIIQESTAIPAITAQATAIATNEPSEPASFPLSEPGPYFGGNRVYTLVDESRLGREIELLIWYPAIKKTNTDGRAIVRDAKPDTSGAPYPVIITEENSGRYIFLSHFETHGFVLVVG